MSRQPQEKLDELSKKIFDQIQDFAAIPLRTPGYEMLKARAKRNIKSDIEDIRTLNLSKALMYEMMLASQEGDAVAVEEKYRFALNSSFDADNSLLDLNYLSSRAALEEDILDFDLMIGFLDKYPDSIDVYDVLAHIFEEYGRFETVLSILNRASKFNNERLDSNYQRINNIFEIISLNQISDVEVERYFNYIRRFVNRERLWSMVSSLSVSGHDNERIICYKIWTGLDFDSNNELSNDLIDLLIEEDFSPSLLALCAVKFLEGSNSDY